MKYFIYHITSIPQLVSIDCGLQIPGNASKRLFLAYQTYRYDCKNEQKNVVGAKKSSLVYTQFDAQNSGNSVSELPDFNFFFGGGACPQIPLAQGALQPLVNTVAYSSQTGCPLQTLLKPLPQVLNNA